MALSFTEGSIGGDIERVDLKKLAGFYGGPMSVPMQVPGVKLGPPAAKTPKAHFQPVADPVYDPEPGGSNGIAIGAKDSANHHALLLINPHTSFFFRSELQVTSDDGLNAYGAVTWGQFFVYQGFNQRAGWMHTSSGVDAVDEFRESASLTDMPTYRYGTETRDVVRKPIVVRYRTGQGMKEKTVVALFTSHGPLVRRDEALNAVSIKLMNDPIHALEQSFLRTRRAYVCGVQQDDGADGELVQQHRVRGC